jgi:uncharacterized membrane protein YccC
MRADLVSRRVVAMIGWGRRWLPAPAQPLLDWLDEHDPGGVDALRGLHFVIAVVLSILAGRLADSVLGLGEPVSLPLYAGLASGTMLFLLVTGRRRDEAVAMARTASVIVGYVLVVALIGGAGGAFGADVLTVLLVPLTFAALYVRRFGHSAKNDGIALFEIALIVATTAPAREQALWFALAAAGGAAIAMTVRRVMWRPIAMPAFEASVVDYRAAAADALASVAVAFAAGTPWPPAALARAARQRSRLRTAALAAVREAPARADAVQAAKAATYRLEIASTLVGERLAEALAKGTADASIRSAVSAALVAAAAAVQPGATAAGEATCGTAIAAAQTALLDATDIDTHARDRLLVALAGVGRIGLVAGTLDAGPEPAHPRPPSPVAPARRRGLLQTTRVALQGLVATLVTTAIYLGFDLDHGYWATLTVAFVLGGSFGETVARTRTRLLGTVVGVAAGMAVGLTVGDDVAIGATMAVAAFAVALVTIRDRYDVSCAFVAFGVLLGLHLIMGLGAAGMIARLYDTVIGAAAALVCARFVLPVALADPTKAEITAYLARCRTVFARLWPGEAEENPMHATVRDDAPGAVDTPGTLATAALELRDRLPRLNDEAALGFRATDGLVRLISHTETVATYLTLIEGVTQRLSALPRQALAMDAIRRARGHVLAAFGDTASPAGGAATAAGPAASAENSAAVIGRVEYSFFADALAHALDDVRAELSPSPASTPAAPRRAALSRATLFVAALCAMFWLSPQPAAAEPAGAAAVQPSWDWIIGIDELPSPPPAVDFLGLDGFDTPKRYVVDAGQRGIRTWCYLSVGTIENWRPDRKAFEALNDKELKAGRKPFIGKRYPEWEGERWLDVRRYKVFLPLMVDRMEMCRDKGFEFVEFDNLDAYENRTGFKITRSDTVGYAKALASEARRLGLKPMQKNVPELAKTLEPHFDALLFEDCALYKFCGDARPFVAAGKPVFDADYPEAWKDEGKRFDEAKACDQAKKAGVSMIFKRLDLDAWVRRCR